METTSLAKLGSGDAMDIKQWPNARARDVFGPRIGRRAGPILSGTGTPTQTRQRWQCIRHLGSPASALDTPEASLVHTERRLNLPEME